MFARLLTWPDRNPLPSVDQLRRWVRPRRSVADGAARIDPLLRGRIFVVADLESTSPTERTRYLEGVAIQQDGFAAVLADIARGSEPKRLV